MVVWRCVITTPGAPYVGTLAGTMMLPRWCVVSLASMVTCLSSHYLIGVTTPTSFPHCTGSPSSYYGYASYGQGSGKILLSGLYCYGYESTLFSCSRGNSVVGVTSCSHSQDASVSCSSSQPTSTTSTLLGGWWRMVVWALGILFPIC